MPRRKMLTDRQREALLDLPTEETAMLRHYTLADDDLEIIRARRRPHNRFGFALQLCALRYPGRLLAPGEVISAALSRFLAAQLGLKPDDLVEYATRDETRREHLATLREIYGYKMFTGRGSRPKGDQTPLAYYSAPSGNRPQCAAEGLDHVQFLARLVELELIDREGRMIERRIKVAKFPAKKSLDSFDFKAIPKLNKMQVLDLARCEWIERRENVIALGPSGTGKTHVALGLGLAACQKGMSVSFTTAAALVNELMEARDERRLLRLQKQLASVKLLIIDELGFVPLSKTGAELLFEMISQRYERGATLITSNLPFDEWTETFGTERLTGALLDRLTHHVNILEMNGESYRLAQSRVRNAGQTP